MLPVVRMISDLIKIYLFTHFLSNIEGGDKMLPMAAVTATKYGTHVTL
jgi:hypothetical protein